VADGSEPPTAPASRGSGGSDAGADQGDAADEDGGLGGDSPVVVDIRPKTSNPDLIAQISEILAPRPIEVTLLTEAPVVSGIEGELQPRLVEMVAYLAARAGETITTDQLRTAIYPDGVADSTFRTAVSRIRRALGDNEDGTPRLSVATNTGVLGLSDEVGVDWLRAQRLIGLARGGDDSDRREVLTAALGLIDDRPFSATRAGRYGWIYDDRQLLSAIEVELVDAAAELAALALAAGDADAAVWAADQGLDVVPDQEALYRVKMEAADLAGKPDAIDTAFRHAQRAAQTIDPFEDVQPETQALYERLKRLRQQQPVQVAR
jgi:DNA-binding SARP family transcriptional activator